MAQAAVLFSFPFACAIAVLHVAMHGFNLLHLVLAYGFGGLTVMATFLLASMVAEVVDRSIDHQRGV